MRDISDVLAVSFDSGLKDESALCVTRKYGEKIIVLKMELGEQADILYYLLTEQMTKAEIKTESEHKRIIDADELLKRISEKAKLPSLSEDTVNGLCGATAIIYDMLNESEE